MDHADLRHEWVALLKIEAFGIAVMLFGVGVVCWQHMESALIGLVSGLVLTIFCVGYGAYKMGELDGRARAATDAKRDQDRVDRP